MKIIKTINKTLLTGFAIAVAPVQPGSPILTFSANVEKVANKEIKPATTVVFIIFIISLSINLKTKHNLKLLSKSKKISYLL